MNNQQLEELSEHSIHLIKKLKMLKTCMFAQRYLYNWWMCYPMSIGINKTIVVVH